MSKPFVLIKLDTEKELRFGNIASIFFEEISGKSIFTAFEDFKNKNVSISTLNYLLYSGLKCRDKAITYDEVIELIDEYCSVDELAKVVAKAFEESFFFKNANSDQSKHPALKK